jgi:hypothetical protein
MGPNGRIAEPSPSAARVSIIAPFSHDAGQDDDEDENDDQLSTRGKLKARVRAKKRRAAAKTCGDRRTVSGHRSGSSQAHGLRTAERDEGATPASKHVRFAQPLAVVREEREGPAASGASKASGEGVSQHRRRGAHVREKAMRQVREREEENRREEERRRLRAAEAERRMWELEMGPSAVKGYDQAPPVEAARRGGLDELNREGVWRSSSVRAWPSADEHAMQHGAEQYQRLLDTMAAARAACDGLVIGNDAEADEIAKALEEDDISLEQAMIEVE